MKKITTEARDGYLHIIGEFEFVRKSHGGQTMLAPRWAVNLHYTEKPRLPDEKVEDDRIEFWWMRIAIAQRSGLMYYLAGDTPMKEFRITIPLPLENTIHIFQIMGDPTEITGHEDTE